MCPEKETQEGSKTHLCSRTRLCPWNQGSGVEVEVTGRETGSVGTGNSD